METVAPQLATAYPLPQEEPDSLPASIVAALAYAGLFDYPLTLDELVRYQPGSTATREQIAGLLATDPGLRATVKEDRGYYSLRGSGPGLARTRRRRARRSARLWKRAASYSRLISRLPYVRMVAVTGALAVNNVSSPADIDLLVVAKPGRVWICRRALIVLVRLARLRGDDLCPNYILAEDVLDLDQRDFFTAHELAQMVPLYGLDVYARIIERNSWARDYLPCAFDDVPEVAEFEPDQIQMHHHPSSIVHRPSSPLSLLEAQLDRPLIDRLEAWELRRMRSMLQPLLGDDAEVVCTPAQCKGHTGLNRRRIMLRFQERLRDVGLLRAAPQVILRDFATLPDPDYG